MGLVKDYDQETGFALVEQRNKMTVGEEIEIFGPDMDYYAQNISEMYDAETGDKLESAPHPQQLLRMKMDRPVKANYMLRKKK